MRKRNKLVCGVGINDVDCITQTYEQVDGRQKVTSRCPFYRKWVSMLRRCYSVKYHRQFPTYSDCTVCDEWLTFSNFKTWMEAQDWEGKELDKDLLTEGNKVYSPDNCVLVLKAINSFLLVSGASRGNYPLGVTYQKVCDKLQVMINNPFTKKLEYLGLFNLDQELEAHLTWKARKHQLALQLADSEYVTDERVAEALRTRYL